MWDNNNVREIRKQLTNDTIKGRYSYNTINTLYLIINKDNTISIESVLREQER